MAVSSLKEAVHTLATASDRYSTLSGLINYIKTFSTNDMICVSAEPAVGLTNESSNVVMVFIFKASSNNAYYCAVGRDEMSIGNISLANGTVSVKHDIL